MIDRLNKENFFSKISVVKGGCWHFLGSIAKSGYGVVSIANGKRSKVMLAHRVSYLIFNGKLEEGLVIDHICRNRKCVNPDHLRQVTRNENVLENSESLQAKNAKKTHCPSGHEYNEKNTRIYNGWRYCKACKG